jgi:hypothetical protein
MRWLMVVIQLGITFIAVAIAMPPILLNVPASRDGTVGPSVALALAIVFFAALRLIWPKRLQ